MKLIFCPKCQDVLKLQPFKRNCQCGAAFGYYLNEINAEIGGKAIPVGFANSSFAEALRSRPETGSGSRFEAFVIPKTCETIKEKR